jgi:hypothetical protein
VGREEEENQQEEDLKGISHTWGGREM